MIEEGKRLYRLGYAIHWLKPNSKRPVEMKWTSGPKKSWRELAETYQYGFNLGVRLGKASRFEDGTYLAVIDCDVKSSDPMHAKEMEEKLKELITVSAPTVFSGRGNGSKHLHCRTKEPVNPYRFSQSKTKVKVLMPSVEPSKFEERTLSKAEIKEGYRLKAAWEISVMGEGQQVVLPPSVHPDTGDSYTWGKILKTLDQIPLVEFASKKKEDREHTILTDFKAEEVDLISSSLDDSIVDLIIKGENCDDRSASLFTASIAMVKAGFTDNQILTILTDPENFLGQTGYEHANTKSRRRAAQWILRYTLKKVRLEYDAALEFESEAVTEVLGDKEAETQSKELTPKSSDWRSLLERTSVESGEKLKPTSQNIRLILENEIRTDLFKFDEFAGSILYGARPPWNDSRIDQEIRDIDAVNILYWLAHKYKIDVSVERIHTAIQQIASKNKFHPVINYLESLEWDGVPRLDTWLSRYLGAQADPLYLADVGRKTLCAMVARVSEPGCKFDYMPILEGMQGVGKSTAVRILAGDKWFSDAHINIADKDAVVSMRSVWVMEMGELSGMKKADVDILKQFVSRQVDRIRLPYGRLAENFPRQCIFVGTTNPGEYLRDTTGNRRFWPVEVGKCDFKSLKNDRDQLLAEAKFAYDLGEKLYLENPKTLMLATGIQKDKTFQDSLVETLSDFLSKKHENFDVNSFTIPELFSDVGATPGGLGGRDSGIFAQMRVAECLRILGFSKFRMSKNGVRKVVWRKKEANCHT